MNVLEDGSCDARGSQTGIALAPCAIWPKTCSLLDLNWLPVYRTYQQAANVTPKAIVLCRQVEIRSRDGPRRISWDSPSSDRW
jgi:hypothetical protein